MKKIFLLVTTLQCLAITTFGQVLFSNSFDNLTLQSYTTAASNTQYTTAPGIFTLLSDGYKNNVGDVNNPNRPFHVPAFKTAGWVSVYNAAENDTFLVSTSWLDTAGVAVDRWFITPPISNIGANTVLTWLAKSPDANYPDAYYVYGTNLTGALIPQSFTIGDSLFATGLVGEKNTWTRRSVNLGPYAGQTLRFAFKNYSTDMYQVWIDDIQVITLPVNTDAAALSITADKYVMKNTYNGVTLNVSNAGSSNISSLGVSYSINNSSVNYEIFTYTPAIAYQQNQAVTFALPYYLSSPGLYTIKSWISTINGTIDQNHLNDTAVFHVTVLDTALARQVMIEQFVSANDGESTNGQEMTSALQGGVPAIAVNIHGQDSLVDPGSAALFTDYKPDYATAMMNRTYFNDIATTLIHRPDYGNRFNLQYSKLSPVSVSIINKSYNTATRQLTFDVKADFVCAVAGDYRINAYLTENNVCGPYNDTTINGFNQLNNYYNLPWSAYYHMGYYSAAANTYVIDALNYKHENTLIHTFDGAYGLPGVIPATGVTAGHSYQKTFTVTLATPPANIHKFNPDNIYIVGFVAEYSADKNSRTVLNAVKDKLNGNAEFVGIAEISKSTAALSVYPNPSGTGIFHLKTKEINDYDIKVYDLFGKCLKMESGQKPGTLDLSAFQDGIYILTLKSGNNLLTEKIIIQKN